MRQRQRIGNGLGQVVNDLNQAYSNTGPGWTTKGPRQQMGQPTFYRRQDMQMSPIERALQALQARGAGGYEPEGGWEPENEYGRVPRTGAPAAGYGDAYAARRGGTFDVERFRAACRVFFIGRRFWSIMPAIRPSRSPRTATPSVRWDSATRTSAAC